MRKLTFIGAIVMASFALSSCGGVGGSSIENDAKEMAELQCAAMDLMEKVMSGDESVMAESEEFAKKAEKLQKEIEEKYSSEEDQEAFIAAFEKELENCK